jgi:hypothetical protein
VTTTECSASLSVDGRRQYLSLLVDDRCGFIGSLMVTTIEARRDSLAAEDWQPRPPAWIVWDMDDEVPRTSLNSYEMI